MKIRTILASVAAASVALSGFVGTAAANPDAPSSDERTPTEQLLSIKDAREGQESQAELVDVVVMLEKQPTTPSESAENSNIAAQDKLIAALSGKYDFEVGEQVGYLVNGFEATIPADQIFPLSLESGIASVKKQRLYYPTEHSARELQGAQLAYENYGVDGTGSVISIIDSGVDVAHPDMRLDEGVCEESKLAPDTDRGFTCKVPAGYNYADNNFEVYDRGSQHGVHVAGIAAANGSEGDTPGSLLETGRLDGTAPNAQVLAMKVFSNDGRAGASDLDIMRAIEDSVKLGADVINMSLGSPNGQWNTSDGTHRALDKARQAGVMTVISASNDGLNFSLDGTTDDILGYFDDATVGEPGTNHNGLTVASLDNTTQVVPVAFWIGSDGTENPLPHAVQTGSADNQPHEIVDGGYGLASETAGQDYSGKYVLVQRGGPAGTTEDTTFAAKFKNVFGAGADGILVYNHASGGDEFIGMGGVDAFTDFGASTYHSTGVAIRDALAAGETVMVTFTDQINVEEYGPAGLRPSDFTSWGPTPTLDFHPNIAGIGGSVYSNANDGKYQNMSGTSMAAPNVTGVVAAMFEGFRDRFPGLEGTDMLDRIQIALQNTAIIPVNEEGVPYAPRQVGSGLANTNFALETEVYATVDGKPHVELREINSTRTITVDLQNLGDEDVTYTVPAQQVLNETNAQWEETTTFVSDETMETTASSVTVPAGETVSVDFTLTPLTGNPHYIEGWIVLESETAPKLSVPYLGFVGDWNEEQIIRDFGQPWHPEITGTETTIVTSWAGMVLPFDILGPDAVFSLSPNGDGDMDVAAPALMVLRNASDVKYEVYTADGELVTVVGEEQNLTRNTAGDVLAVDDPRYIPSGMEWDGLVWDAQEGQLVPVPDGDYIYRVSARLGEGFDWQTVDLPFNVDTVAPIVHLGDFTPGENGEPGILNITIEENNELANNPSATADNGQSLKVTAGGPGAPGKTGENFQVEVPEGVSYVTISVLDMGFTLGVGTLVFDEKTLVVASAESLNSKPIGPKSTVVVDGDQLRISGYTSPDIATVVVAGEEYTPENGRFHAVAPIEPGANTIEVVGLDADGNEVARETLTPFYDVEAPIITVTNAVNGVLTPKADGSLLVTGTVSDNNPDADLVVSSGTENATVSADGSFSITVTPEENASSVTLVASDGVNTSTIVVPLVGFTAPAPGWDGPTFSNAQCTGLGYCFAEAGATDYQDGVFTLKGKAVSPISQITVTPEASAVDGKMVQPATVSVRPNADGTFEIPLPATVGVTDYILTITDIHGVIRHTGPFQLYLDVTPPTIAFEEPTLIGGTLYTDQDEVLFKGTASDDGWGYTFKINDSTVLERFNFSGHGPESNERTFEQVVAVANGDQILLFFNDAFGNVSLGVIPVVVDKVVPEVTFSAEEGDVIRDATPVETTATDESLASLQVSVTGPDGYTHSETLEAGLDMSEVRVEDVLLTLDEAQAAAEGENPDAVGTETTSANTTLTHSFATDGLADGQYTITATATDLVGHVTVEAVTVNVDSAPVIEGPDTFDLELDLALVGSPDAAAKILENYSVNKDGVELTVAPGTTLARGENTVTLIATTADGYEVEREVTVNVTIEERTLTDGAVSATGEFRSDDTLTVTVTGTNPAVYTVSNKDEFAVVTAEITLPAGEGATVSMQLPNGELRMVDVNYADGKATFTGPSKATYEVGFVTEPVDPVDPEPEPTDPVDPAEKDVERFAGRSRVATSVVAAQAIAEENGGLDSLVIAGVNGVPDMLAGTPLAEARDTAVVFTAENVLSPQVKDLILNQGITEVTVLGGTTVVSQNVVDQLEALGVTVDRIYGRNRFYTSVAIAEELMANAPADDPIESFVLATGMDTADALVAGPLATKHDGVILLTWDDEAPAVIADFVADNANLRDYAVGGPAVRAADGMGLTDTTDYNGRNRWSTAAAIVNAEFLDADSVALANGVDGVDAAIAGPWAANNDTGVLLTERNAVPAVTLTALENFDSIKVFGGTTVISEALVASLK